MVAHWKLESTSRLIPHQTNEAGSLVILEAVTDAKGRFYFPAWGPKLHLGAGDLGDSDPELILFKSGYKYLRLSNSRYLRPKKYSDVGKPSGTESKPSGSKRISFWNGEAITLEPFKGATTEQFKVLMDFSRNIESFTVRQLEPCNWLQIPRTLKVMTRERVRLERAGVTPTWDRTVDKQLLDGEGFFSSACGQPAMSALQELKDK